jgi:hypothetical protein
MTDVDQGPVVLADWVEQRRLAATPTWQLEMQAACDELGREIEEAIPGIRPESPQPPSPDSPRGQERAQEAKVWLEDLLWHKQAHKYAVHRWWPDSARGLAARMAGGQTAFTTLADLRKLETYQAEVQIRIGSFTGAIGFRLGRAFMVIGDYEVIAAQLGMTLHDVRMMTIWGHQRDETGLIEDWELDAGVADVVRFCQSQVFNNRLIEAWELRQQAALLQVVANVFEDATIDLLQELTGTVSDHALVEASGSRTAARMRTRIQKARAERGLPGDPRRVPNQFSGPGAPLAAGVPPTKYWRELQPWDLDYRAPATPNS